MHTFLFHYSLHGLLSLGATILSISVGGLALSKEPKSGVHRAFFLITLTGAIWLFQYAMFHLMVNEKQAYLWLGIGYLLGIPYISPSVYLFSVRWTNRYEQQKKSVAIGYGLAIIFGIVMFLFSKKICIFNYHSWGRLNQFRRTPVGLSYYVSILAFFYTYATLAFQNLWKAWKTATSPQQKIQARNFLIGFFIGYTGSIDFLVAGGLNTYAFGYISFSIFILIVSYTIIRHQFLDIRIVLKRISLIFLIYAVLFAVLVPILFPILRQLLNQPTQNPFLLLGVSIESGLVFSLGPLIYAYLIRHSFWLRGHTSMGLTHELKSPLGVIQSAADVILADLENARDDKQKLADYVRMIQQNAARLDGFVKSLLDVAKTEEGTSTLNRTNFDFRKLLHSIIENFKPLADQKGIQIQFPEKTPIIIDADQEKIQQVLSNLLSNALKYSDVGVISVKIHPQHKSLLVSIKDEGRGVPKQSLERIFDRFYQVDRSQKGGGIGLTIAKAWVEAHGGKIWAESEGEGKGTKVTFTLPL